MLSITNNQRKCRSKAQEISPHKCLNGYYQKSKKWQMLLRMHGKRYPDGRKWRRTKNPLDESERGEWKSWLKAYSLTFRKLRLWHLAPSPHGKKMGREWKQCQTLFWGGSKITADDDCSYEVKRFLLLGRIVMINLDSILKSKDTTLSTKVRLVKSKVFPMVMYGCES